MLISIICNIVLFFPGGEVKYATDGHITQEVLYMGGLIGGGFMVSSLLLSRTGLKVLNLFLKYAASDTA